MTAAEFQQDLVGALEVAYDSEMFPVESVSTFEDAGILTGNSGLIVRIDGSEFQVTIVRSR